MLGGLGLLLASAVRFRQQAHVNAEEVVPAHAELKLSKRLHKRHAFDVANCAAEFNYANVRSNAASVDRLASHTLHPFLNSVGDVRDHLNRPAEKVTFTFAGNDVHVNFARCDVVVAIQLHIQEAFVISKIQINLTAIVQYKYFTMFEW
ncbi:hypothetical protein T4B_2077 [Trichinella pseudospiralis]|uniref:Uncharacterized protein n=1 Tax=Trichinella pseudospiralis TaxID=6337 RepID=A0A0V1KEU3_TRIPS|nr:hypothetical protein T4B_2077 [Trichinella pseudospiralis]KRZ45744.1 hypothetical protein T4C_2284 [Trichinella pseudospiralis]